MRDKLTTLEKAAAVVQNGAQVVMTTKMTDAPMALLRQLVRQGARDLRLIGVIGGAINIDFLVGAGAVGIVDTASVTLGEFARSGPNFARQVMAGKVMSMDNT